jgi:predicted nucleic acid-binding protein
MATVVIDADFGLALVVNLASSAQVQTHVTAWRSQNTEIVVPALWWYEIVSGLRKAVRAGILPSQDAIAALDDLGALNFKTVAATPSLYRRALYWAEQLQQTVAYDAHYLALAENLQADLWTGDTRLAKAARAKGIAFVRAVPESSKL